MGARAIKTPPVIAMMALVSALMLPPHQSAAGGGGGPGLPGLPGQITRIDTDANGVQANGDNGIYYDQELALSADGHLVAFMSNATNLVPGGSGAMQVFVKNLSTGLVTLASAAVDGTPADQDCFNIAMSGDGRFVTFASTADNLVAGLPAPVDQAYNVFVKDLKTRAITVVTAGSDGTLVTGTYVSPVLSGNGRFDAFYGWGPLGQDPDNPSYSTLVLVKDRYGGTLSVASTLPDGTIPNDGGFDDDDCYYPAISADGRYVAFFSQSFIMMSAVNPNAGNLPLISAQIFVKDMQTGALTIASSDVNGNQGDVASDFPAISANGRIVAFLSAATNLGPVSEVDCGWQGPCWQVMVKNLDSGAVTLVSADPTGAPGNNNSWRPMLSGDGRYVIFSSMASNLVPNGGDTNGAADVFVKDLQTGSLTRVNVAANGSQTAGDTQTYAPALSGDGRLLGFISGAPTLAAGAPNGGLNVFVAPNPLSP